MLHLFGICLAVNGRHKMRLSSVKLGAFQHLLGLGLWWSGVVICWIAFCHLRLQFQILAPSVPISCAHFTQISCPKVVFSFVI